MDIVQNKIIQFEVWNECDNNCIFCSNKYVYNISDEEKLKNLQILDEKLSDPQLFEDYNIIGLIGGEFFQHQLANPLVNQKFFDIVDRLNGFLNDGKIKQVWITATLTKADQSDLLKFLDHIDKKEAIWICTSYDTKGRFHTQKLLDNWKTNLKMIKEVDPKININVTTILTGSFIEEYISGRFNINQFTQRMNCSWYSKPPMLPSECQFTKKEYNEKILPDFFPTRKRFLEFLLKFRHQESEFDYSKLFGTEFRADALVKTDYHNSDSRMVIERNKTTNEEITKEIGNQDFVDDNMTPKSVHNDTSDNCKHNRAYTPYVDSDKCFYCDKEYIRTL